MMQVIPISCLNVPDAGYSNLMSMSVLDAGYSNLMSIAITWWIPLLVNY